MFFFFFENAPELQRTIRPSYLDTKCLPLTRRYLAEAFGEVPAEITIRVADSDAVGTGNVLENNTVTKMAPIFEELNLAVGDRISFSVSSNSPPELTVRLLRTPERTDARGAIAEAVSSAEGTKSVTVVGCATGPSGYRGGVNTANHLLLEALNDDERFTAVSAIFGPPPAESTTQENLRPIDTAYLEKTLSAAGDQAWIIGHGKWTGHIAQALAAGTKARRAHVVHTSPLQIAGARGSVEAGRSAVEKVAEETALASSADLVALVGNASSSFTHLQHERSLPLWMPVSADEKPPTPSSPPRDPAVSICVAGRFEDWDVKGLDIATAIRDRSASYRTHDQRRLQFSFVGVPAAGSTDQSPTRMSSIYVPFLPQDHLHFILQQSSMTLLPSAAESFGLFALESLWLGRPCLVSNFSGISSLYRKYGYESWIVDSEDPDARLEQISQIQASQTTAHRAIQDAIHLATRLNLEGKQSITRFAEQLLA